MGTRAGMPSSKRTKMISLTKVAKQGRKRKEAIVETILECLDNYSHVYVYNVGNVRTGIVKTLRNKFAEDRFVMGKQTVMALGVGRSAEEEPRDNLHKLSQHLTGTAGLLFSNRPRRRWWPSSGVFARRSSQR